MTQKRRPRRQKKSDRLTCPDASKPEIACDYAIAPLDREALLMEMKWGIERLPELVSPEMASRYGNAMGHLNECLRKALPAECAEAASNCIRGLRAMDAEAEASGAPQATGNVFEFEIELPDGELFKFGVLEDGREWQSAKAARPDLRTVTKREVALALHAYLTNPLVIATKNAFPGSEITKIKPHPPVDYRNGGDPIPF